jgi:hypothetical protein
MLFLSNYVIHVKSFAIHVIHVIHEAIHVIHVYIYVQITW